MEVDWFHSDKDGNLSRSECWCRKKKKNRYVSSQSDDLVTNFFNENVLTGARRVSSEYYE